MGSPEGNQERGLNRAASRALIGVCLLVVTFAPSLMAIHLGGTESGDLLPYSQPMTHPLDEPVNRALNSKAFMMNLGPTGIRADIRPEYPKAFKVKFVFNDKYSPAKGKIKPGDMIIGVEGKEFKTPHAFHRKKGGRGWPGPPFELAGAIERAQGGSGKLSLLVLQGGKSRKAVTLQLKAVGKFSPTWPWNCKRSDQLLKDLLDFSFSDGNVDRMKRHKRVQMLLALWASGDSRAIPLVKDYARKLISSNPNYKSPGMGQTWMWGYNGILIGEYYYMTRDKKVMPFVDKLLECYEYGQFDNGSYGHRPRLSFLLSDRKPYASMAAAGGICMLAQSIFRASGLPYNPVPYQKTHLAYLRTAGPSSGASVAYGFAAPRQAERPTDHAVLKLKGKKIKEPKPRPYFPEIGGKDMPIKGGLRAIGSYEVEWPTPKDHRWRAGCIDWLKKEAAKVEVRWAGPDRVVAWRHLPLIIPAEPTKPYRTTPNGAGHQAGSAPGALAHLIGNDNNKSWGYLGMHMATGCALSPKMLWDGHADAGMHSFFGALAAGMAEKKDLRTWLDYTKTWIILSETHEPRNKGGLVDQPFGCQRNGTASIARGRTSYTHVAIAALSFPKRRLLLTGAPSRNDDSDNPMQYLLDSSFEVQYFDREARMLEKGDAFKRVLVNLRKGIDSGRDEEKQAEAQEFYDRLKKWIIERTYDELNESKNKPGQMLPKLEAWMKMVDGLPPEPLIDKRIDEIKDYDRSSEFLKIYKTYEKIQEHMSKNGYTSASEKSIEKLRKDVGKLIEKEKGEAVLLQEAQSFLDRL